MLGINNERTKYLTLQVLILILRIWNYGIHLLNVPRTKRTMCIPLNYL